MLGGFMEEWFRRDAVPNLAPNTIVAYLPTYNNHIRALPVDPKEPDGRTFGELPLSEFAEPHIHQEFRESLRLTGRWKSNKEAARKVLSSALSWGVESRTYRRWLPTNGAKLATTRRRRSNRPARQPTEARLPRSRVFNAYDYEFVRSELRARTEQRTWEPHRDATFLDLMFGCGLRPEEARGERWWQVLWPTDEAEGVLRVREVIAAGQVAEGKTVGSFRDAPLPRLIADRLRGWREIASAHGLPTGLQDFIIPGRAPKIGKRDAGGHMTANQEKKWGGKYLKPACEAVAGPTRSALTWPTPPPTPGGAGTSARAWPRGKACRPSPATAARRARRSSATTRTIWATTSSGPTRLSRSSLRARRWRLRASGFLGRRRPRHCAARPVITTGSARRGRGPKPRSCPAHHSKRAHADVIELVPRGDAVAAPERLEAV